MSVSALYLDAQLQSLEKFGFARPRAYEALGIAASDLDNPRFRASLDSVSRLYDVAGTALKRPSLSADVGADFRVAGFAKTGRVYAFCRNIREVVEINARYQPLAISAGTAELVEEGGRSFLHFAPSSAAGAAPDIIDLIFGSYATAFTWLGWGAGHNNLGVYFRRPRPDDTRPWRLVMGCPVHFDAPHDRLEFHPDAVDAPLPTSDPRRLAQMRERLEKLLEATTGSTSALENAVRAAIALCLRDGAINMDCVAARLDRTSRRLRSDLSAAGLNFRALLDDVRVEVYQHERERGRSLAEIAQRLCYNDQAAFNRAFRRWFGKSPKDFERLQKQLT